MGVPSVKTIKDRLDWLDKTDAGVDLGATLVRQAMEYAETGTKKPTLKRYIDEHNLAPRHRGNRAMYAFEIMDHVLETFGVEYLAAHKDTYASNYGVDYLNTGHTYTGTVMYDYQSGTWKIGSWGDMVESYPYRFV